MRALIRYNSSRIRAGQGLWLDESWCEGSSGVAAWILARVYGGVKYGCLIGEFLGHSGSSVSPDSADHSQGSADYSQGCHP